MRKKLIPDPGVKKNTGSRIQIRNNAVQFHDKLVYERRVPARAAINGFPFLMTDTVVPLIILYIS